MTKTVSLRFMIERDYQYILDIEKESFDYPWTEKDIIKNKKIKDVLLLVAEYQEIIVGYIIFKVNKNSITIIRLAVHPDYRYKKIGTKLLDFAKQKLNKNRTEIKIRINERLVDGQMFFKKLGFICTDILKDFYDNSDDSAYLFVRETGVLN